MTNNGKLSFILTLTCGLTACGGNPVKTTVPLDLTQPGSIEITATAANSSIDTTAIAEQTGKNLAGWQYPIAPSAKPASHRMNITIGSSAYGSTPTGFSFSVGNSDPRALDFQKADVLPITCKLESIQQSAQSAVLNMGFADSAVTGTQPNQKELTDHVSTVCFNLLNEVNWPLPKASAGTTISSPNWMPEIRIETEEEDAIPASGSTTKPVATQPEAEIGSTSPSNSEPESSQSQTDISEETPKTVTKEINKEGHKVYIIHNQGNPILFKFGHERK